MKAATEKQKKLMDDLLITYDIDCSMETATQLIKEELDLIQYGYDGQGGTACCFEDDEDPHEHEDYWGHDCE